MKTYSVNDFNYDLPSTLIAQFPMKNRAESRLLIVRAEHASPYIHTQFPALLDHVCDKDLIIFNDTKVMPARLFGKKVSGGKIECLIERVVDTQHALAHIKSSHAPSINTDIIFEDVIRATVIARQDSLFLLAFSNEKTVHELLEIYGHLPLPPYITRTVNQEDWDRYQTVYAKNRGAVAAPTAGLHFDETILTQLKTKNVRIGFLTLHVGAGTFQPVRVENIAEHTMHSEMITVSQTLCDQITDCHARGGRVIAIGTTVARALESVAVSGKLMPYTGETRIFITPGFTFRVVDKLLTNFHLPQSTLLMLVSAFAGYDRIMHAYREAVQKHYRFFSYGDAMLLSREMD